MTSANRISSFAVFDLETTGLPDYNFNKANITEISIHGLSAKNIRDAKTCDIPRINYKLTLLFNPRMMIHPEAERITGLNNYMLEEESSFDVNAANMIINFVKHLKPPVCLVAHNGNRFDFPILKKAFDKLNMELPSDVVVIDSLLAIKELDRLAKEKEEDEVIPYSQEDYLIVTLSDGEDPVFLTIPETENEVNPIDRQKLNETTPKRAPNELAIARKKREKAVKTGEKATPPARRSLFNSASKETHSPNRRGEYTLETIYRRCFNQVPEVTHHAEADVVMLEKVMLHYGESFVEYAEAKAKPFADVKKVGAR